MVLGHLETIPIEHLDTCQAASNLLDGARHPVLRNRFIRFGPCKVVVWSYSQFLYVLTQLRLAFEKVQRDLAHPAGLEDHDFVEQWHEQQPHVGGLSRIQDNEWMDG